MLVGGLILVIHCVFLVNWCLHGFDPL
jgi:hypothetical protein